MTSSYAILFSVDLLSDYYKNGLCTDFAIVPAAETAALISGLQLVCKNPGNRIVVLTKLKRDANPAEDGKPFVTVPADTKFVFYLGLNKPEFLSLSNINLDDIRQKRFYFTNINRNKHLTFAHLTAVTGTYDNTTTYQPGDLVDDGTKKIFECIKTGSGIDTTDTASWFPRSDVQYATSKDLVQPVTAVINHVATVPATVFDITVFGLDTLANTYTKVAYSTTLTFKEAVQQIQIDLSKLRNGRYRITVNGEEQDIYKDDELVYGGYLGVVEIFTHLQAGTDFAFLDLNGKPVDKTYFIRFANRLATWKYLTPKHGVTGITHPLGKYSFSPFPVPPAAAEFFQSNLPVPLTQFPEEFRLQLSPQVSSGPPRAPGPDISVPGVITRPPPGNDFYCNIHLNY